MKNPLIIPTAEPFLFKGGPIGVLLVHGFTGTPKEMRLMGDYLSEQGHTVLGIRLAGHATQPSDLARAHWQDWLASVEDGLNLLKTCTSQQVIIGLSMGGLLTLVSAARYKLAGIAAISTPSHLPQDWRRKFLPILQYLIPEIDKGAPDWRDRGLAREHIAYPAYPTKAIPELIKLIEAMHASLSDISIPVLLMQSTKDNTIPQKSMEEIYAGLITKKKKMIWYHNSNHIIIREPDRFEAFEETQKFILQVTGKDGEE